MLTTSAVYKQIMRSGEYHIEWKALIGGTEYLSDSLISCRTQKEVIGSSENLIGNCVCGQIDISLLRPSISPAKMAEIQIFIRLVSDTGDDAVSEWLKKGIYYISSRKEDTEEDGIDVLYIHGYDAMLKTEQPACSNGDQGYWPKIDIDALEYIADQIGVTLDSRTESIINRNYIIPYPGYGEDGYSLRELLGFIASMYAGNAIITDEGKLRIICLNTLPEETDLLSDEYGDPIIFGSDAIIVGS